MTRLSARRAVAGIVAAILGLSLLLAPVPASAADTTTIEFSTPTPVSINFGEEWQLVLTVRVTYEEGPTFALRPTDGTVDVYFSGIAGVFVSGVAIQPDGHVYLSQPDSKPLLPAGSYNVSAIFNPAAGSFYASSQTAEPLAMSVAALAVSPRVEVSNDAGVSPLPVISGALSGSYVDETGGAPAGTWHFVVSDAADAPVFETDVAQPESATEPVRVEVNAELEDGATYTVSSTFTPVTELAGGVTVAEIVNSTFQTPSGTFGEALTGTVPMPPWLAIAILTLILALAGAATFVGVKLSRRRGTPIAVPGEPDAG